MSKLFQKIYDQSINNPEKFWQEASNDIFWFKKPTKILNKSNPPFYKWFEDGVTNTCYNALDIHIDQGRGKKTALIYDSPITGNKSEFSYDELKSKVSKFAGALKDQGITKGDRVIIYMPMIPELTIATLACARIGAIHSVVFAGFSAKSLADRINDSSCNILVTTDGSFRGNKQICLKDIADEALGFCKTIESCIVFKRTGEEISMKSNRDFWWHDEVLKVNDFLARAWFSSNYQKRIALDLGLGYVFVKRNNWWEWNYDFENRLRITNQEGAKAIHTPKTDEICFGNNRGNVYEFAHLCIDAGADLLLGHGPHVTRAVELYKDRFIAYSMGNFCTYARFNLKGPSGVSPIFDLNINSNGEFISASVVSIKQIGEGIPVPDISKSAWHHIVNLSKEDFPESPLIFNEFDCIISKEQ